MLYTQQILQCQDQTFQSDSTENEVVHLLKLPSINNNHQFDNLLRTLQFHSLIMIFPFRYCKLMDHSQHYVWALSPVLHIEKRPSHKELINKLLQHAKDTMSLIQISSQLTYSTLLKDKYYKALNMEAILHSHPHTSPPSIFQTWRSSAPCRHHMYQIRGNASSPSVNFLKCNTPDSASFILTLTSPLVPPPLGVLVPRFKCNVNNL
jgi:hypothetical protein